MIGDFSDKIISQRKCMNGTTTIFNNIHEGLSIYYVIQDSGEGFWLHYLFFFWEKINILENFLEGIWDVFFSVSGKLGYQERYDNSPNMYIIYVPIKEKGKLDFKSPNLCPGQTWTANIISCHSPRRIVHKVEKI